VSPCEGYGGGEGKARRRYRQKDQYLPFEVNFNSPNKISSTNKFAIHLNKLFKLFFTSKVSIFRRLSGHHHL
jgi:hypothetical protein